MGSAAKWARENAMTAETQERPLGGHQFEAAQIAPCGWLCLTPWIQTPDGHWWRANIEGYGHSDKAREWAEHVAEQINRAMK